MSGLVSLHNNALDVACPKCGAKAGKRCRTLTTGRSTDLHEARWLQWFNRAPVDPIAPDMTGKEGQR